MSRTILAQAFKVQCPDPTAKLVLLNLADKAEASGYCCCPFISLLARRTGLDEPTVRECLKLLERKRLIRIDRFGRKRIWIGYYLAAELVKRPTRRPKASLSLPDLDWPFVIPSASP